VTPYAGRVRAGLRRPTGASGKATDEVAAPFTVRLDGVADLCEDCLRAYDGAPSGWISCKRRRRKRTVAERSATANLRRDADHAAEISMDHSGGVCDVLRLATTVTRSFRLAICRG
jgi:hypothetical protein